MIDPIQIIEQYYPKDSDIHYILLIHSEHVRDKALAIAARNPDLRLDLDFIAEAAMLHDIGKVGVSDLLLKKPGSIQNIHLIPLL